MPIKLNSTGGGAVSLTAPSTANTYTVTMLAATGNMVLDSDTQTLTNKTLTTPNIDSAQFATVSGTAPIYPCRAWVNFNGTGTVAIRASGNVTSITDNGTGDYTVNFTTAMSDASYSISNAAQRDVDNGACITGISVTTSPTTSAVRVVSKGDSNVLVDVAYYCVSIFR